MSRSCYWPATRWVRAAVITVAVLTVMRVWLGPVDLVQPAFAQLPDSGLQRKHILEETRRTNELLERILNTLETRTFNVRIEDADKKFADPVRRRGG